ncbi:hypothetical protein HHK36_007084 [Tetracentron sinense]|uniref:Uncharacterized protein n=1 Tax=Tetracentron sinense TaxID=13715 RepID=A0A835DPM8_TETSI|nr:hypothetical protein HHK36_007084 [Tetracentron sinense]
MKQMGTENPDLSNKEGESGEEEMNDNVFSKRGYCCFWMPCWGPDGSTTIGSEWWERIRTAEKEERWWSKGWKAWKRLREWSEIVAGPRWKTFIRRFNKNRSGGAGKQGKFQYDPLSYALNFDEGPGQNGNSDDDYVHRDFSCRFASIPNMISKPRPSIEGHKYFSEEREHFSCLEHPPGKCDIPGI